MELTRLDPLKSSQGKSEAHAPCLDFKVSETLSGGADCYRNHRRRILSRPSSNTYLFMHVGQRGIVASMHRPSSKQQLMYSSYLFRRSCQFPFLRCLRSLTTFTFIPSGKHQACYSGICTKRISNPRQHSLTHHQRVHHVPRVLQAV